MDDLPVIAIIPARLGSTRLPGKVLLRDTGRTLIQHAYEAARRAPSLTRVVVATDDQQVAREVRSFGGECVMTSPDHPNGTSRLAEACERLGIPASPGRQIIVNVQGDEPELEPEVVDAAVGALRSAAPEVECATVAVPFAPGEDPRNPNLVKVVRRLDGTALYFSRALIPMRRDAQAPADAPGSPGIHALRHVGLYVYRRCFLARYVALAPAPLEQAEHLEQLRVLEHGHQMAVALVRPQRPLGAGIDTREQYDAFVARWRDRA